MKQMFERTGMVNIPKDPVILLSFINTKLRDFYSGLDDLCGDLGLDRVEIENQLKRIDYTYDERSNRFI